MRKALLLGGAIFALSAGSAAADITVIASPPYPNNPTQNVLLNSGASGMTITGNLNQSSAVVLFTGNETLTAPANGQARVTAVDGGLTFLNIQLTNAALGFTTIEFNLDAVADGTASVQFVDNEGQIFGSTNYALGGSGSNFFTAVATNNQQIVQAQIRSNVALSDVAQVRIGGVTAAVPEPATWGMMIVGFGMVGAGLRRRRQLAATAA